MNEKVNLPKKKLEFYLLRSLLAVIICLGSISGLYAQTGTHQVSGTITSDGEGLIGASVVEKGTTNGVSTDLDGNYVINVSPNATLEISYVGFETRTIPVNGQSVINLVLEEKSNILDEVVAIGYGVQKKKLNTGATLQVKGDNLEKRSTTTAFEALQGQTPGVQITSMSGQPGDGYKVVVRGMGTIGNAGPLFIVDGVQTSDISHINNSDIESIDVLKDAASAAIYGSQAANGVILVTTKTGRKGHSQISFDAYYGIQNAARKAKLLNAQQYAVIMNESNINSGLSPYFTQSEINNMGGGTSWMNEMFKSDVATQSYTLSATGGSEKSIYSMSLGYTSQGGIVGGKDLSNYDRYSFRINTEHNLYENIIKLGQHATFTYIKSNGVGTGDQYNNTLRSAFNTSPFLPMYDDNGNYVNTANPSSMVNGQVWNTWYNGEANPYAIMEYENQNRKSSQKLIGDVYLEANPIDKLKFRTTLGFDYFSNDERSFQPEYQLSVYDFKDRDRVFQSMSKGRAWNWDNVVSYSFDLKDEHRFDVMAGMSARQYSGSWLNGRNAKLTTADLAHAWLNNATNTDISFIKLDGGPDAREQLLSYFGRVNYNWKEKYLANATFRADGSSKFHKDNRWGYFPSISLGWIASSEQFMEKTSSWLDYLKIRGSWGQVGNQDIESHQYLALVMTNNAGYIFGQQSDASQNIPGAYQNTLGNSDLKWETSEQYNFGFDANFLNSRLIANLDLYYKKTKDWLVEVPALGTSGVDSRLINGGDVVNKGIEFNLSYNDRIGKDFNYNISGNITYNKNKVGKIPTNDQIIHGETNQLYDNSPEFYRAANGKPIGYFWGYKTAGIFQNQAQIDNYVDANGNKIQPNAVPGDVIYVDANKDGRIDENDKTKIGDPNPDVIFGLSLGCTFKNFDFSVTTNGTLGNQIVQSYRNQVNRYANYTTRILDRWHGEGTSNKIPRVTNSNVNWEFSDLYVQDGDYWRISNITLGYDFSKLMKVKAISQLRVYASVQNVYTFTKYDGMDPEIGYGVGSFASGVDVGFYPNPRTFLMGVNVKF